MGFYKEPQSAVAATGAEPEVRFALAVLGQLDLLASAIVFVGNGASINVHQLRTIGQALAFFELL